MKVSLEDREGLFKSLLVEVQGDVVKKNLENIYQELVQNVEIEGFRKGKAPLWLIKAKYKDYIREEVGKRVADATLSKAIEESGLKPAADIYLEEVQLEEKEEKVAYRVVFEVPPSFELKLQEIENLRVEIPKVEFKEEMVQEEINRLREQRAFWEPVDREIKEGDLVVIDYRVEDLESGETSEGETTVIVGQRFLREEIDKALLGKKEGEEVEVESVDLFDAEGKVVGKAKVKISIRAVKEKVLPEVSDDFAKELGLGDTWSSAEEKIRQMVKENLENYKKFLIEEEVAKKLIELHDFEVPQTLLRRELNFLVERRLRELSSLGIDTRYINVQGLAQELLSQAIANIKLRYILDKYAQTKNLQAEEKDLEEEYTKLAQAYGVSPEQIKADVQSRNLEEVIKGDVLRRKALEDIMSKVQVIEVEEKKEEKND
ncbi:MAG: trigger factor [Thermocrinis sp.]|jgi:trigger factor|uniref:trigger factor n=1 Tax=Thermocrinis sp. TaxID=2024383 RepID=UPI003BFF1471